jgi:hypothetical protein
MECAGLIGTPSTFCFSSIANISPLIDSPIDPGNTLLNHYLIATWTKICQAMGPKFNQYLPAVMPLLVNTASTKADISVRYAAILVSGRGTR